MRGDKKSSPAKALPRFKCPLRADGHEHPKPWQPAATQSVKRVPHRARPVQYNSGEDQLFPTTAPDSNATASAVGGWQHQEQRDNQKTAQPDRKAGFALHHYTAKRMIRFLIALDRRQKRVRKAPGSEIISKT